MIAGSVDHPSLRSHRIVRLGQQDEHRWEAFVAANPNGLIYHHPQWLRALEQEYQRESIVLACEDPEGQIQGILPLLETWGLPFNVGRQVVGRRLASLPRTPVAGPLASDNKATACLVQAAVELVRQQPGTQLQLKVESNRLDALARDLVVVPWRMTYVLDLPEHPDLLRFGNSRNHARIRWAVNKAARSGVSIRAAETESDLRRWYELYLDTVRWHAAPPRPYRLFQAAWDLLRPRGLMRLLLAEQSAAGGTRLLAGSMFMMFGRTVFYAFNGRRREDLALRPNDAIHWRAAHDACREGFLHYDFGEVPEDNQGLAEYKGKWATEPRQMYRYYYPWPSHIQAGTGESVGLVGRLASTLWRHLPLRATTLLGEGIFSFL